MFSFFHQHSAWNSNLSLFWQHPRTILCTHPVLWNRTLLISERPKMFQGKVRPNIFMKSTTWFIISDSSLRHGKWHPFRKVAATWVTGDYGPSRLSAHQQFRVRALGNPAIETHHEFGCFGWYNAVCLSWLSKYALLLSVPVTSIT